MFDRALRFAFAAAIAVVASSCSDDAPAPTAPTSLLEPGEVCDSDIRPELKLSFDPPNVVLGPGTVRPVRLTIEPDACEPMTAAFTTKNVAVAEAPPDAHFDLRHATYDFQVKGGVLGKTAISVSASSIDLNGKEYVVTIDLPVEVRDPTPPTCSRADAAASTGTLAAGTNVLRGKGSLGKATVSAPPYAFTRTDEFALPTFQAEIGCAEEDLTAAIPNANLEKLGPAVSFTPQAPVTMSKPLRRDVELSIPVNPATFPPAARLRHLVVLYKGPRAKTPRPVPVSSPRIEADGADYVLKFSAPYLGTYQAAVARGAGDAHRKRRLTHRAVIGFSMGGGGAAVFGMRHHDKFDVIAPLGGPSDWTWLLWYVDTYVLGGFCPAGKTCPTTEPNRYPLDEPFAHTMDYDNWFYEKGSGNGGSFPRDEYVQIFEDLALAMGNTNGKNADPTLSHMAPGPTRNDPWVTGPGGPGNDCTITVDPIDEDPDNAGQKAREAACKAFRCDPKNIWKAATNYFDATYNPDGSLPVISFCDGKQRGDSPYTNGYVVGGDKPVNLALAVDLNRNGIRDPGEPVIRASHEPYDDCGADGVCDENEPGYDPITNPDPNQDDYDYFLNPTGLEGNHRWDPGEPFKDYGLDGVPNTAGVHVAGDPGENDGKYTEAPGLTSFYENDAHGMLSQRVTKLPAGPVTDDALRRIDILADGGVRDLFNFATVASHLSGQIHARTGPSTLPLRSVAFYNGFDTLPGEVYGRPDDFTPALLRWADIADMPNIRYGDLDASRAQIEQGDGQHVGKANQLLFRLETAFFFVGKAWPDADRRRTVDSREQPAEGVPDCEVFGRCEHEFTSRAGRRGPIAVSLPPGYAQKDNVARNTRYPVLYVLHGYGQEPKELEGVAIFTNNFMNVGERSYATRLPKFIIVYVDGRCRVQDVGGKKVTECIRGTFYMNSARADGAKMDDWFDELTDWVDHHYRTMGPSEVDVAE